MSSIAMNRIFGRGSSALRLEVTSRDATKSKEAESEEAFMGQTVSLEIGSD